LRRNIEHDRNGERLETRCEAKIEVGRVNQNRHAGTTALGLFDQAPHDLPYPRELPQNFDEAHVRELVGRGHEFEPSGSKAFSTDPECVDIRPLPSQLGQHIPGVNVA
jgi:hypothetical protein